MRPSPHNPRACQGINGSGVKYHANGTNNYAAVFLLERPDRSSRDETLAGRYRVVGSAGNFGPDAQRIAVPSTSPYLITVGAVTNNCTPNDPSDDGAASLSPAGPTYVGFVTPGTSQAAAVTSGVVELMLHANPWLTSDQVKCRLLASAEAAIG